MGNYGMVKGYAALVGVVLVVSGLLGFINNPIVGPGPNGDGTGVILAANTIHNTVHLAMGALALYIAYGLSSSAQANGVIGFGVLHVIILVLLLISPTLFGLFGNIPANIGDHVLHVVLGVVSVAVGYMARGSSATAYTR